MRPTFAVTLCSVVSSLLLACGATPIFFPQNDGGVIGPALDGGGPALDGGSPTADGGAIIADGGAIIADGGAIIADGGVITADGGVSPDGGPTRDGGVVMADGGALLAGERCENAEGIEPGTVAATLRGYTSDYAGGPGCAAPDQNGSGPDRVYSLTLPARSRLTVSVTPMGFDVVVNIVAGPASNCRAANMTCLAGVDGPGDNGTETVTFTNSATTPRQVFIIVDGFGPGDSGTFTMTTTLVDVSMLAGDTCARAEPLAFNTPVSGTTTGYANDFESGAGCAAASQMGGSGPDRMYSLTVPAGKRLTVSGVPSAQYDIMLDLILAPAAGADCARTGGTCLAGRDQGMPGQREDLVYTNTTGASQAVIVIVDGFAPDESGTYELTAKLDDPPPPNSGDTCASAVPLTAGQVLAGTTVGYANDYGSGGNCHGTPGADRIYRIDLPAAHLLSVTVNPTGALWDVSLNLMQGTAENCGGTPRACVASASNNGVGQAESATFSNQSNATTTVFIAVESPTAAGAGTFNILATIVAN